MIITQLNLSGLRNLKKLSLHFHPELNYILGPNGSGKTSLLEGIHLACRAKSFRTSRSKVYIARSENQFECFGQFLDSQGQSLKLGFSKDQAGCARLRCNGEDCKKLSDYAGKVFSLALAPDSVQLVNGSSEVRRSFIDWGMFHVKHSVLSELQRYGAVLKQRNNALKKRLSSSERLIWDQELIKLADPVVTNREAFFKEFSMIAETFFSDLIPELDIQIEWVNGWTKGISFADALREAYPRDAALGFTTAGPHRADLKILSDKKPAIEILSRGQVKLVTAILYAAQTSVYQKYHSQKGILLIDDLEAEFDKKNIQLILNFFISQGHQLFITGLDEVPSVADRKSDQQAVFHVKHGVVSQI